MSKTPNEALKKMWKSMTSEQREEVAKRAETTPAYLRQVLACGKQPGASMAKAIEEATEGRVSRQTLRPDLFADLIRAA